MNPEEHRTPGRPRRTERGAAPAAPGRGRGSGAPACRLAVLALTVIAFLAIPAAAWANGNVTVTVAGPGTGSVTSVSETLFFGSPHGVATTTPGEIECDKSGGPVCAMSVAATAGTETRVSLTATPEPEMEFLGWQQAGATKVVSGCETSTTCAINLNGSPGPTSTITATFACVTPMNPPGDATGGAAAGRDPLTRTLEGTVNPNGCGLEETFFEYGTTTEYGNTTATRPQAAGLGAGKAPVPVTAETDFLEPETTYHYRLVAVGPGGTAAGEDQVLTTGSAPSDTCPNALFRAEQGTAVQHLPDCMALEMVSPPEKHSQPARFPSVSLDGSRIAFAAQASLGTNPPPAVSLTGSIYVASRGGSGWNTQRTLPDLSPDANLVKLTHGGHLAAASFTPDFTHSLGIGSTTSQLGQGIGRAFDAGFGGSFRWLSEPLVPLTSDSVGVDQTKRPILNNTAFAGASADHSHLYFVPGRGSTQPTTYLPGDPTPGGTGADGDNTYLVRLGSDGQPAPEPELLQRDESGKVWGWQCGARLGGIGAALNSSSPAPNGDRNQGAVSADGTRTYFSARAAQPQTGTCLASSKLRILERLETPSGPQIEELISDECDRQPPEEPCGTADGDDLYQGASLDQSKVYFTTNRQLANTDLDGSSAECDLHTAVSGCDLYLYDRDRPEGEQLIQVSAGEDVPGENPGDPALHERGKDADAYNGITAISADGSRAYFVATGVLTGENAEHKSPTAGQPNLYMWDLKAWEAGGEEGGLSFLGRLDPGDEISFGSDYSKGLWGGQGTWKNDAYPVPVLSAAERRGEGTSEEGGDGHILVFETHASLTANDADGGHLDVYRYDSDAETLQCVSCAPGSSEARPDEAPVDVLASGESLALGTDFAELGRWASEDGQEVIFATAEGLLPGDSNGAADVYLWREGQLYRLPGASEVGSLGGTPALSPDGATVAFVTASRLVPEDGDNVDDIYVARADGGFPPPPPPLICQGEECRGQPSAVPSLTGAGTAVLQSPGNVKQKQPCKKGKVRRKGHCVAKKHKRCKKGKVRRKGRCVAKKHKRAGKHRHGHGHKAHKRGHNRQADTDRRASR